ncbi:Mut7-C ubiquitin/RNAse domain-containing protein [Marinobacterium sp. D7]|uniref:Mut7-C ubiquitin/RNAse domain-containing protein n=1 Tax=Marinobacterium ramblicola TaxID=2849041 RepID=UPI001C2CF76F|nr:Mut7-C ubiquitin/RNAse domain-containing protein [Marinobacterium ramblicola]MBV1790187.1 Mut7-C ubiquitin/RNAse domain-containing protein [Marinobacterium ramblicola]
MVQQTARIRFYAELNDFLPQAQRMRDQSCQFIAPAPVRHLIELCGVPHTEVELILVDGRSVDLEQRIDGGERISVYPCFERLDIAPLLRVRTEPLREIRFIADAHLGHLVRDLRMLGFDTLFNPQWDDAELARISAAEHRILLTRDRALLMRREITHGCYLRHQPHPVLLKSLIQRLDLCASIDPFCRCIRCNGHVSPADEEAVAQDLPPDRSGIQAPFYRCDDCRQVYWKGSHYRAMLSKIARLCPTTP